MKAGASTVFIKRLAGLEVLAADGRRVPLRQLDHGRRVHRQVRRAVGEGHALAQRRVGINLRGRNGDVVVLQALLEGLDALVHGRRLDENLRRSAPDHHHAVHGLLEGPNVGPHLLGQVALVLALLHVRAVEALHVVLVEDRRQRLDRLQVGLQLLQRLLVQHLGVRGGLVDVVLEDVPAGKDQVVQIGQRHKVLDQRRFVVGALAQADGAHLRQRSDRLGQSAADGLDSGDHRGGDGAQADHHHSQFARGGRNLACCLLAALLFSSHRFS